ncbi:MULTISPECIES: DUF4097 family beta strand repeat-containing protein [Actinoplanes]|uniref:DUF4097 family beta strand repeat-containing protein n=1 Tax=Actinoplanes TaxID=1865 RepID=UPI0005F29661|nr:MULTISPECIES: DUF4097 family beta strand repeat-containing protein [Actinoplanes]GLY05548.1 hypothetical protein Acsp01_59270 [Actinoplanes sp. NBRC 101535]
MQRFDTPAPVAAQLDIPAGRIQLIAADRTDTRVEIRPANADDRRDVQAAERVTVDYRDGVLRIIAAKQANRLLGSSGSVDLTVQLPAGSRIDGRTASAEVRGAGRLGDVEFEGAQGSITFDETANAHLSLQSGDVTVGRLGGSGRISTQQGDLRVTEAVGGAVTLSTQHGDITVGAARGTAAALEADTSRGRIVNALRNPEAATTELAIRATTAHGDITARSL